MRATAVTDHTQQADDYGYDTSTWTPVQVEDAHSETHFVIYDAEDLETAALTIQKAWRRHVASEALKPDEALNKAIEDLIKGIKALGIKGLTRP